MKRILIADDDSGIAEVTSIVLQQAGFDVEIVTDVVSTRKSIEQELPALILMDIRLAGGNGVSLTQEFKTDQKTKSVPIVLISANNNVDKQAKEAGADGFIEKPYDIDHLVSMVKKLLSSK